MNIKLNADQWNGLSDQDKKRMTQIISGHFKGSTIAPDANVAPVNVPVQPQGGLIPGFKNPFCTAACDIGQAAAVAACSALSGGVAIAICVAAAQAAGDACRDSC